MNAEKGAFEIKKLSKQRWLDLVLHEFDEQVKLNPKSEIILISHRKLVKFTSYVNNPRIQALIGYAVTKGLLPFKSAYESDSSKVFTLTYTERPVIDTNFKVFAVDEFCADQYQAKFRMDGKAIAVPMCPKGDSEKMLKMFKFAKKMDDVLKE